LHSKGPEQARERHGHMRRKGSTCAAERDAHCRETRHTRAHETRDTHTRVRQGEDARAAREARSKRACMQQKKRSHQGRHVQAPVRQVRRRMCNAELKLRIIVSKTDLVVGLLHLIVTHPSNRREWAKQPNRKNYGTVVRAGMAAAHRQAPPLAHSFPET
jgi:hypothetical protein